MAVFILVLATLLAGCSGKGGVKATNTPPATASFDADTGGIEGLVWDEDLIPIGGVEVGIRTLNITSFTDEGGKYALSLVPPGKHKLEFQKIGFQPIKRDVEVLAGEKTTVNQQLAHDVKLIAGKPYFVFPLPKKGHITCSFGGGGGAGEGYLAPAKDHCAPVTGVQNTVVIDKDLGQNLTGFIVSVKWTRSSLVTGALNVELAQPALGYHQYLVSCTQCSTIKPNIVQGPSRFEAYYDTKDPFKFLLHPNDAKMPFTAFAARGNGTDTSTWGMLLVNQDFEVGVIQLYNGAAVPDGFKMWDD